LANVETFLRHGLPGNCQIAEIEVDEPKLTKNEDLLSALEKIRRRGREIGAAIHTVESAPYPSSYAGKRMGEMIEKLAQRGAPDVSMLIEVDRDIAWPTMSIRSTVHAEQRALAFAEVPDTLALNPFLSARRNNGSG
jgi:hypothetical protein